MPGTYPGTAIPFQRMPLPQLVQEVLGGSGHVPVSDAAFDYGALAAVISDAAGRLRAVSQQLQGAHEGEAADASRRHLERLALVGDAGEAESRLSMTALLDQSRHVAQVRSAVESAQGPLALGGRNATDPFLAPLAERARAVAAGAAEAYQVQTNGNYRSAFQPFEPPAATSPGTAAPDRGTGGATDVAPAAAGVAAPAAPGPALTAGLAPGGGAGPTGAVPAPVVPGTAPAAVAAAGVSRHPGVLPRTGTLPPHDRGRTGSAAAHAAPGALGAASAGGRPLPDGRGSAGATGARSGIGLGSAAGAGSGRTSGTGRSGTGRSGTGSGTGRGGTGSGTASGAGHGGTGSGAGHGGTGHRGTAHGGGTGSGGRDVGDGPSSGRGANGGVPGRGAPLPPETAVPRSSGGEAVHGSTRPGPGVPLMGGAGMGAGGQDGERARPQWLLEDDPDAVWFAGIADWTAPVIGGGER